MTTRSQKRKAVAELASGSFEFPINENNQVENPIAGSSKSPKIQSEKLDEIKTSLRKETMSDLTKIVAENQKEMLKLIVPVVNKPVALENLEDCDSRTENVQPASTSTPIRSKTTTSKKTPVTNRNRRKI